MLDKVAEDQVPVFITRRNGKRAVLLSEEYFESLDETAYLLSSPKNARRLMQAKRELEAGKGRPHMLIRKMKKPKPR
jgi:antitoxin YefM